MAQNQDAIPGSNSEAVPETLPAVGRRRPSPTAGTTWEDETNFLCNSLMCKFEARKNDLKDEEKYLQDLKNVLEGDLQNKIKEYKDKKKQLEDEYEQKLKDFEDEKIKMGKLHKIQSGKVKLDVGGHNFTTSLDTLSRDPDSMLAIMFSGRHMQNQSEDGSYFIDRDGTHFRYVLNYLRGGIRIPTDLPEDRTVLNELNQEVDFYQLKGLRELIREALGTSNDKIDYKQEEITEMMSTLVPYKAPSFSSDDGNLDEPTAYLSYNSFAGASSSRCNFVTQNMTKSDLDFTNKTLNGISFAHTTFFHNVSFRSANLVGASFYGCEFGVGVNIDFSYADLTDCDFRQCKGKRTGYEMNSPRGSGGLVSGSSSEVFLKLVTNKNIEFRRAKLKGAMFDPQVYKYLISELSI